MPSKRNRIAKSSPNCSPRPWMMRWRRSQRTRKEGIEKMVAKPKQTQANAKEGADKSRARPNGDHSHRGLGNWPTSPAWNWPGRAASSRGGRGGCCHVWGCSPSIIPYKKKGQKRIKSLIEHTKAKKQKGLWQGPPQPGASWNGTRELQCQWKTLQGQRQWKTKCHPTMAPGSIQPLEPVPVEAIPMQKEVELKLEVQQKIHGAADSSILVKKRVAELLMWLLLRGVAVPRIVICFHLLRGDYVRFVSCCSFSGSQKQHVSLCTVIIMHPLAYWG